MRTTLTAGYRLLLGLLTLYTVGFLLVRGWGPGFRVSNFLSYFTIQSNVIGGVVLVLAAVNALRGRAESPAFALVRGASVLYLATTGVVFEVLLSGLDGVSHDWTNFVLHQLLPVVMVADWLLNPPPARIAVTSALWWLAYPFAYLAYTLVRGPIADDFYPYPFLDPNGSGGYGHVAVMSAGITVWFVLAGWFLVWVGNVLTDRARRSGRPVSSASGR